MTSARAERDIRGQVVLRMCGGTINDVVLEAAARIASAFKGEIHGVFEEDRDLLALAQLPDAREVFRSGRTRTLSIDLVRNEMRLASLMMSRRIELVARSHEVPVLFRSPEAAGETREEAEESGILALAEPLTLMASANLLAAFAKAEHMAGLLVAGRNARYALGKLLLVLDRESDGQEIMDTAHRLSGTAGEITLLLTGFDEFGFAEMKHRLETLTMLKNGRILRGHDLSPQTLAALASRTKAGMVVARIGGPIATDAKDTARYAERLPCPLLLLRREQILTLTSAERDSAPIDQHQRPPSQQP
ncbi:MAG: hypothetical protein AB7O39_10665 [Flavobacteriaceae bacterium]